MCCLLFEVSWLRSVVRVAVVLICRVLLRRSSCAVCCSLFVVRCLLYVVL